MAAIREIDAGIAKLQPSEVGINARQNEARTVGRKYDEAGNAEASVGARLGSAVQVAGNIAVDHMDHAEITRGAKDKTLLLNDLTKQWDEIARTVDPNKADAAREKFNAEVVEPALEKFQDGFATEKSTSWAQSGAASLRDHLFQKTAADVSTLAKDALSVNVKTIANASENTAAQSPDFHTVDFLLKDSQKSVADMVDSSQVKGADAASAKSQLTQAMKERIVKAGALSAITKSGDPEATAAAWTQKYPELINGSEAIQFAKAAKAAAKVGLLQDKALAAEQRREQTDAFHKAANAFEVQTVKEDENGIIVPTSPKDSKAKLLQLAQMPGADPGRIAALTTRLEQVGRNLDETTRAAVNKASIQTRAMLFEKTQNGEITDPKAYREYYVQHPNEFTFEHMKQLEQDFYQDKSATGEPMAQSRREYLTANEGNLDPARMVAGLKSPDGSVALNKASQALRQAESDLRKAGKDPQDLYKYDPTTNIAPADAIIARFRVPLSQLPGNLQRALGVQGAESTVGGPMPVAPAGMSVPEAVKKFGKGATVRVGDKIVTLPNE